MPARPAAPPRRRPAARARCRARTAAGSTSSDPSSTLRPLKIMKMRSQSVSAAPMSCVENTTVVPCAAQLEHGVAQRLARSPGSRPENGSSRISSFGCETTAAMNWTFCAMPFDSCRSVCRAHSRESERLEPASDHRIELARRPALEPAVVPKQAAHRHLFVEAALFREITDVVARGVRTALAEHGDLAAIGQDDVHDHPDRCRLAGSVRPDEAVDRSVGHVERHVVDGAMRAERLADAANVDCVESRCSCPESSVVSRCPSRQSSSDWPQRAREHATRRCLLSLRFDKIVKHFTSYRRHSGSVARPKCDSDKPSLG